MNARALRLLDPVFPAPARTAYLAVLLGDVPRIVAADARARVDPQAARRRADPQAARARVDVEDAWRRWRQAEPSLVDALKAQRTDALAATLPFLDEAQKRRGLPFGADESTRIRAARLREELRAKAYAEVLGLLLDAMTAAGVEFLVLGGRPLAEILHGDASLHHSGAIDLLVRPDATEAALAVLRSTGLRDAGRAGDGTWSRWRWFDASGLPVTVASKALAHPFYRLDEDDVWAAAVGTTTAGRAIRVPALHHQLALLALRGAWTGSARSLLWLVDAATLLGLGDRLDGRALVVAATRGRHALPLLAVLRWLSDSLGVAAAEPIDAGLSLALDKAGPEDAEAAFALAAAACANRLPLLARAAFRAGRPWLPLRFGLVPSRATLEWESGGHVERPLAIARLARLGGFFSHRRAIDG